MIAEVLVVLPHNQPLQHQEEYNIDEEILEALNCIPYKLVDLNQPDNRDVFSVIEDVLNILYDCRVKN